MDGYTERGSVAAACSGADALAVSPTPLPDCQTRQASLPLSYRGSFHTSGHLIYSASTMSILTIHWCGRLQSSFISLTSPNVPADASRPNFPEAPRSYSSLPILFLVMAMPPILTASSKTILLARRLVERDRFGSLRHITCFATAVLYEVISLRGLVHHSNSLKH